MFTFQRKENQTIYINGHLPPHLQGVVSSYLHIYKVWYPYSPTFTRCGILIPPYLQNMVFLYLHIHKVWYPYTPTFTRYGILIPLHLQGVVTYTKECDKWCNFRLPFLQTALVKIYNIQVIPSQGRIRYFSVLVLTADK